MKILDIISENNEVPYTKLSDAGKYYQSGSTEIWYLKTGADVGSFDPNTLYNTHAMVGTTVEKDPETILSMMQIESWDPSNQAEKMLHNLGVSHTSMRKGDVIVIESTAHVVLDQGFKKLGIKS